jgi:hypothetical protein
VGSIVTALASIGLDNNAAKTQVLVIGLHPETRQLPDGTFNVAGTDLQPLQSLKYLGFNVDPGLSFINHYSKVNGRLRGANGSLGRLLCCNRKALRICTDAVVQGTLLFHIKACLPANRHTWESLERLRCFQARSILGLGRDEGGEELLRTGSNR